MTFTKFSWALVFAAVLGLTACDQDQKEKTAEAANAKPTQAVNSAAPAGGKPAIPETAMSSPIKTIDGKTVKLADYKGKVVIVNFWATWCGPCRQEIPHLIELREEMGTKEFEVIGVTHNGNDPDPAAVKEFAKQFKITYPVGYAEASLIYGLQTEGVANNIPQSFIISRDGQLIKRFIGFGGNFPAQMRAIVQEELKGKSGD
jgi:thiol-disulfide isomerase/thioredoxin